MLDSVIDAAGTVYMSIVKATFGRRARDAVTGERRRSSFAPHGWRKRLGWYHVYLAAMISLIVALCYKMTGIGTLAMLVLATGVWVGRQNLTKVNLGLIVALLYVADATTTAFLVSFQAGVYRSAQFFVIGACLVGVFAYSYRLRSEDATRMLKIVGVACCVIFAHLIIYHFIQGRYITWKYLYDTKVIISLTVFIAFALKDQLTRYVPFPVIIMVLSTLVIMSAERKALLLLVMLLLFANIGISRKVSIFGGGAVVLMLVAVLGLDGGYLYSKLQASSANYREVSDRYFTTVHNIGDYSDIIRDFTNRKAWQLFEENPWFGIGATGYWEWANATYGRTSGLAMNVHGEVHRIPAEGGIVGMIIVATYLIVVGWRTGHFAFLRRQRDNSSLERAPFYMFLYVICYAYAEALDSAILLLIGLAGAVSARLPAPTLDVFVQRTRHTGRTAVPLRASQRSRLEPSLVKRLARR